MMTRSEAQAIVEKFWHIASLVDGTPTKMFVTSTVWGGLRDAIVKVMKSKGLLVPTLTPENFRSVKIGTHLTVINSGSEDQEAVDVANKLAADRAGFGWKRDHWITGRK